MRIVERIGFVVVLFGVIAALGPAGAQDVYGTPKSLTAQEFTITNKAGKVVIRLTAAPVGGGGQIELLNAGGKRVARLFARSDHDGELQLYDEGGAIRSNIGGNDTGGYANFYNKKGKIALYAGADSSVEAGYLALWGPSGKKHAELLAHAKGGLVATRNPVIDQQVALFGSATDTGVGLLSLADSKGKRGLALFSTSNGGQVKVLNGDGKDVAFLGVSANPAGNGLVYVARKDGQRIFETGANASRGGYLSIHNGTSKRVVFLGTSSGKAANDGVFELARANGTLGVVARAYSGGNYVQVCDQTGKPKKDLR